MNIRQLRAIHEVVKQGMKVSSAAEALCKAQPGVSRQIKEVEEELGVEIFRRSKNRIAGLTAAGGEVLEVVERILRDVDNLHEIGREYSSAAGGELVIATTHTHAKYSLPRVIEAFARDFPGVELTLKQGDPAQACALVREGGADIAICTEPPREPEDLVALPIYSIGWDIVASVDHPILREKPLTLDKIARYPIITHDAAFSGKRVVMEAFSKARRAPRVVLSGVHAEVSKAYVERGLGIAVLSKVAYERGKDRKLRLLNVEHLFQPSVLNLYLRRQKLLRSHVLSFVSRYAPHLPLDLVRDAAAGRAIDPRRLKKKLPALDASR